VELEVRGDDRLPDPVEVCVYYVASEALTNAIKHAQATYVVLDLEVDENGVRLEVSDDGVGGADARGGSGLTGLTDRLHSLGGRIEVRSPVGEGTRLRVVVPAQEGTAS
jgi:signal transduction histidine kinase